MVKPLKLKTQKKSSSGSGIFSIRLLSGLRQGLFYSLPYILSLTAVGLLFGTVIAYALNSSIFQLSRVTIVNAGRISQAQAFDFCELKPGESLISLDLVAVQEVIKRKHPEYKEVLARRVLPNEVEITLKRRTPVAQALFSSRYVQLDQDRVLLPGTATTPFRNLVIIEGAKLPSQGLFVGVVLEDPDIKRAVKFAQEIQRSGVLRGHVLTHVNITDPNNIVLRIDGQMELRFGGSHLMERLKILDQTLRRVPLDPTKIFYIDLRFDDVVIGPR